MCVKGVKGVRKKMGSAKSKDGCFLLPAERLRTAPHLATHQAAVTARSLAFVRVTTSPIDCKGSQTR